MNNIFGLVCIRCSLTIAAIEQPSSSQHSISKKRKTTASFQLRSSDTQFPDTTVSPEASVSSTGTVVSGDFCSDRSCCSSSHFKDLHSVPSDLQTKGFQTVEDSTNRYFKPFRCSFSYLFDSCFHFGSCCSSSQWVDSNTGVRTDDVGFTLVDLNKLAYQNDPFIMAEQAKQSFVHTIVT
ncbi:uncharacterized protein [Glycine max]|uniref:uncharacterized protein n=1 Tax=Glycine max TaxID=3847 RepID=UPI001B35714C|nr:uncharacterized protein LOC121174191 [Glycine max]